MTELTGTEVSRLTAILTGGGFKRANSKASAVNRFIKIASEKGIAAPDEILKLSFAGAEAALRKPARKPAAKDGKPSKDRPRRYTSKRDAVLEAVKAGKLPEPPDFTAETHARYRGKLAQLIELAKAGDARALKAIEIKPYSSSPKAMDRYRNLCVLAIEARG